MIKKLIADKLFKSLEQIKYGTLTVHTPEGITRSFFGSDDLKVDVEIKNWSILINLSAKGDIGLAESYRDGDFETDNLVNLIILVLKNTDALDKYIYGRSVSGMVSQVMYYLRSNSIKGSKRNIHAHYDLGNEFYSLWLDPSMTYSSALFKNEGESLETAQNNKYDRIINSLENKSGSLLEVGCGWGGFADRASETGDFGIKGITISDAQFSYAKKRLDNKANIALKIIVINKENMTI